MKILSNKKITWITAFIILCLTYATIFIGRDIQLFLKKYSLLNTLKYISIFFSILLALLLIKIYLYSLKKAWILAPILLYASFIVYFFATNPEEILHLFYYGSFAFFLFFALKQDLNLIYAIILTLALAALAGYCDELIQNVLPSRYFGWNDVWLNALSGSLGVLSGLLVNRLIPRRI